MVDRSKVNGLFLQTLPDIRHEESLVYFRLREKQSKLWYDAEVNYEVLEDE